MRGGEESEMERGRGMREKRDKRKREREARRQRARRICTLKRGGGLEGWGVRRRDTEIEKIFTNETRLKPIIC